LKNQLLCVAAVFAVHSPALKAQDSRPTFEVASIKECKYTDRPPPSTNSPGRLSLACWPLWRLIADAYGVFATGKVDPMDFIPPRLEGPDWINSTRFSIDAKAEGPQSPAMMMGPMMQTLLESRFELKLRREIREVPAYIMTVAKGGSKLQPTQEGACTHVDPLDFAQSLKVAPGGKPWCVLPVIVRTSQSSVYDVRGVNLDAFFKIVYPGRPVIDRTGLTGPFDIHLELQNTVPSAAPPDGGAATAPPDTSLVAAIGKQLGLRLDPGKGPHEFLVIDHVEKPTGN
jgi:uncharacterized protein (TIGR03435 family)